jgi:hypothetical protein
MRRDGAGFGSLARFHASSPRLLADLASIIKPLKVRSASGDMIAFPALLKIR